MISREQYFEGFERMIAATERLFGKVPADKLEWAPKEGMLTCGQQMIHMAGALAVYAEGIASGTWTAGTIEEILKKNHEAPHANSAVAARIMRRSFQTLRSTLAAFSESDLLTPVFSPQFGRDVPRWQLVIMCMEHHLNHKAELFLYLRLLGIAINSRDLYFGEHR